MSKARSSSDYVLEAAVGVFSSYTFLSCIAEILKG